MLDFTISPNPTSAWARVDWPVHQAVRWQVFNALGQQVAEGESANGSFNIRVQGWEPGIYILKAESAGQHATGRLLVLRP